MEIICPHCNFSRSVDSAKVPDRPVKVTCPKCQEGFSFDKSTAVTGTVPAKPSLESQNSQQVSCPACGLAQAQGDSCSGCGVIYAKWQAHQQARAEEAATAAAATSDPASDLARLRSGADALTAQTQPKAGFWIRVVASLLDGLLLMIVQVILGLILGFAAGFAGMGSEDGQVALALIINLLSMVLSFSYYIFFTGYCGQTPGKMAVRIKVIRTDSSDISYGRAFLREVIGKTISGILLLIGYIMVAFDSQKQGLHDKIADTYVIKL
jgi:predicted Zn finger-like uncharacterized protein